MNARRLHYMRWAAWLSASLCMCVASLAADSTPTLSADRAHALTNRIEHLRNAAMANAYYLRSAYLRHTATYAADTARAASDGKGRILDSIMLLSRALEFDGEAACLWWEYAALNSSVGNAANVLDAYEHLSVLEPGAGIIAKLGSLYELRGEPDRAVAAYTRALSMDASNVIVRERIVDVYVEQGLRSLERGDRELAQEQLRRALDELGRVVASDEQGRRKLKEGLLQELLGNEGEALDAYAAVHAMMPDSPEPLVRASKIHYARGERLDRAGRQAEAAEQFARAAQLVTNVVHATTSKPELLNYAAYALAMANIDLALAEKLVREAIASDEANGAYSDTLGWIKYRSGAYDEALKHVLRARDLEGDDPVIADHLGDIYLRLGQPDKARLMWEQSLRMDDDNKPVQDKLKTCGTAPH